MSRIPWAPQSLAPAVRAGLATAVAVVGVAACGGSTGAHHSSRGPAGPDSSAGSGSAAASAPPPSVPAGPTTTPSSAPSGTGSAAPSPSASSAIAGPGSGASAGAAAAPAGLDRLLEEYGPHDAVSPVGPVPGFAALAHASPPPSGPLAGVPTLVDVYHWDGSGWRPVATDLGSGASLDPLTGFTVTTGSLTGGPAPDFVVSGAAGASASGLFVVAQVSGRWEAVPVDHPSGGVVFIDSRVTGNEVEESTNSCVPDCADGRITATTYRFSPGTGRFEPAGPVAVSGPGQP